MKYTSQTFIFLFIISMYIFCTHPAVCGEKKPTPTNGKTATPQKQVKTKIIKVKKSDSKKLLLSLRVKDTDITPILKELADLKNLNLVMAPDAKGKVSLSLRDVHWKTVLEVLLRTTGLASEEDSRILYIYKP